MRRVRLWFRYLPTRLDDGLDRLRQRLAHPEAILDLSLLGLLAGVLAAVTIIALRLLVEEAQLGWLAMDRPEDFESLPAWARLAVATAGGLLVGLLYRLTPERAHTVGILHVLERLAQHQGRLPVANILVQFIGGGLSMIAGHSVGREGPSAHLGAASSNLPAQALLLPNNSLRTLAACGAAAGIAASFNTPLAGAIFATEVLLLEYTVAGFAPIIMATVSATALSRLVFGDELAYDIPRMNLGHLNEMLYILLCGVLIGLLSGAFNRLFAWVSTRSKGLPSGRRAALAGLLVGLCGLAAPEVMGVGNDTVNGILLGQFGVLALASLLVLKVIATAGGIGLGLPGGLIGPILFVGAAAGCLLHAVGAMFGATVPVSAGIFTLVGMAAMMSGMLMAPLASLVAIMEMSGEPHVILPGMLAVVAATITSGYLTGRESVFHALLRTRGLIYREDPVVQSLRRIGVVGVMERGVDSLPRVASAQRVDQTLGGQPKWIRIQQDGDGTVVLKAVDLLQARRQRPDQAEYDLMEIPAGRYQTAAIDMRASLHEAQDLLDKTGTQVLLVVSQNVPGITRLQGVLTRQDIEHSYRL